MGNSFLLRFLFLFMAAGLVITAPAMAHEGESVDLDVICTTLDRTELIMSIDHFSQRTVEIRGEEYVSLDFCCSAGYVDMDKVGHPRLPQLCTSLIIPDTAKMEIRVTDSKYHEIRNIKLAPWKGPITREVSPGTVPYTFGDAYGRDAFFPGELTGARDPFILRDVRGMTVEIKPFQYNPVTQVLRVYDYVKVEVVNVGPGSINVLDRSSTKAKPSRVFETIYMNNFPNYGALTRTDPPTEDGEMLIIAKGSYMAAMQPFVDWKNSIGISTSMVDVATIGNNSTSIFNHIKNVYNATNLAFVLLVGEANDVKSGYFSGGASDPYYSCITADWYPDLLIGRFSAQNVGHVDTQVERSIAYEMEIHDAATGDWNARGLCVASNQGPGHHGEYDDEHCDLVRDELLAVGFNNVERSYDYTGTKTKITNALNNGVRIVNYTGHGGSTGWGNGGGYNVSDVHQLTNAGMLPFVSSVACNVGEFTVGECFHEAWQWSTHNGEPTGAIAGYGSTVGQYWDEPMFGQANHCINNQLGGVDRFWMQTNWTVAGCWFGGSCIMMDICGNSGRDMFMTWICFGDPSLRLYGQAAEQTLTTDSSTIPVSTGATITFTVCPGQACANYGYLILGSMTGASPGTPLPGGETLPLNWDYFTDMTVNWRNTSIFTDTYGVLDANGEATATFNTQAFAPYDPRLAGTKFYFSALLWEGQPDLFDAVTNFRIVSFVDM